MESRFPRSCYDQAGGLVYFARMLDKIRLRDANALPKEYHENLGTGFDARCCTLLGVTYEAVCQRTFAGGDDVAVLQWCFENGRKLSDEDIEVWNAFMTKRGWRDATHERLVMRLKEAKLEHRAGEILTMFDFIEVDEGRVPPKFA
jgi:gluconokinase